MRPSFLSTSTACSTRAAVSCFLFSHCVLSHSGCFRTAALPAIAMVHTHGLCLIRSDSFDQIHFLHHEFAVSNELLQLPLLRGEFFSNSIDSLLFGPSQLLFDLVPLAWIGCIARASDTCKFRRTHVGDDAHSPEHF